MSELKPDDEDKDRGFENAVMLVAFVILVAAGVWLLVTMADLRKSQDCVGQGRHNCGTIDLPARSH